VTGQWGDINEEVIPRYALPASPAKPDARVCTLSQTHPIFVSLREWIRRSYRGSLLRLAICGLRSCYHRIHFERSLRGTLRFDGVRRSIPQVPCSDSRNEMQFCSRGIQSLELARPYMTIADAELFLQGWFQATRWHAHVDKQYRRSRQNSFTPQ
jgi:hypothetical protein